MSFPSGQGTNRTLDQALAALLTVANNAKSVSASLRQRALNSSAASSDIVSWSGAMAGYRDTMDAMSVVPGLAAYAQSQYTNPGFDIVAEFNTMKAAIDTARAWVLANYPKAGTGELLERSFDANGRTVPKVFTAAQLAPLTALLDTLIASID